MRRTAAASVPLVRTWAVPDADYWDTQSVLDGITSQAQVWEARCLRAHGPGQVITEVIQNAPWAPRTIRATYRPENGA